MKIIKWEQLFIFDNGERELMWFAERKKGKLLQGHEIKKIDDHKMQKLKEGNFPFLMVLTYADGTQKEF